MGRVTFHDIMTPLRESTSHIHLHLGNGSRISQREVITSYLTRFPPKKHENEKNGLRGESESP